MVGAVQSVAISPRGIGFQAPPVNHDFSTWVPAIDFFVRHVPCQTRFDSLVTAKLRMIAWLPTGELGCIVLKHRVLKGINGIIEKYKFRESGLSDHGLVEWWGGKCDDYDRQAQEVEGVFLFQLGFILRCFELNSTYNLSILRRLI